MFKNIVFFRFRMEINTPKKLVNGDLRCYICGSTPPVKERIKVFGKTARDLPLCTRLRTPACFDHLKSAGT